MKCNLLLLLQYSITKHYINKYPSLGRSNYRIGPKTRPRQKRPTILLKIL